ncbi:hypothetical protein VNO77_25999 [Canavalia gladiata]|uniref:TF-B3 domain-containing protein n=1 Tax=Canavalia gladiata TaxID=3824 RepID=A0AAN9Q551_CANGL
MGIDNLTVVEAQVLQLLETMQQEKDPQKWYENIFGEKGRKQINAIAHESQVPCKYQENPSCKKKFKSNKKRKKCSSSISNIHSQENVNHVNGNNLPCLPPFQFLQEYILEGAKPLEKQLTLSDVNENLNRLMFNKKHVENFFLPLLKNDENDENIQVGIQVCGYDIDGNKFSMVFKKWTEKYYVLNGEWKNFVRSQTLQNQDFITVWMFRHSITNKLCFAFDIRKSEE